MRYDRARRAAWSEDVETLLSVTEPPPLAPGRRPAPTPASALRAALLRAEWLTRGADPDHTADAYTRVLSAPVPVGVGAAGQEAARGLRDHARVEVARALAAAGRPDTAELLARSVDEGSDAFPDALALRAGAHLAMGETGRGLGLLLVLEGPLSGRWFAPATEVWAAVGAANGCDAASARARLRRYHAHAAAVRADLDPTSPLSTRLDAGRPDPEDPILAPWAAADPELAALLSTIALLREEGAPALVSDLEAYTRGARQRLAAVRGRVEAELAASDAFAARLSAALGDRSDAAPPRVLRREAHRPPEPFTGEFWPDELETYRVTYAGACAVLPVEPREVDF